MYFIHLLSPGFHLEIVLKGCEGVVLRSEGACALPFLRNYLIEVENPNGDSKGLLQSRSIVQMKLAL